MYSIWWQNIILFVRSRSGFSRLDTSTAQQQLKALSVFLLRIKHAELSLKSLASRKRAKGRKVWQRSEEARYHKMHSLSHNQHNQHVFSSLIATIVESIVVVSETMEAGKKSTLLCQSSKLQVWNNRKLWFMTPRFGGADKWYQIKIARLGDGAAWYGVMACWRKFKRVM